MQLNAELQGGNVASVKIPVATRDSKKSENLNADHLVSELSRCPCNTTACTGAQNGAEKITVLCFFNDSAGLQWAWPETSLSLKMKN